MTTTWTPDLDEAMKAGFQNGLSASLIGKELGITRNAVLGRKFRLNLCGERRRPAVSRHRGRSKGAFGKRDSIVRLGHAARAAGFTVAEIEQIAADIREAGL